LAKQIKIYTDGGCRGNPGIGAYGVVLIYSDSVKTLSGFDKETTNNKMELTAAIKGLEALKEPCVVELFTDSSYLKNGITTWIHSWQKNGWRTADKKPVKNLELWQELLGLTKQHEIKWNWVKAHSGNKYNELADALCNREMDAHSI
jgi:ribonuclease HI